MRSVVAVVAVDSYSFAAQVVSAEQMRSVVADGADDSYSFAAQVVQGAQVGELVFVEKVPLAHAAQI